MNTNQKKKRWIFNQLKLKQSTEERAVKEIFSRKVKMAGWFETFALFLLRICFLSPLIACWLNLDKCVNFWFSLVSGRALNPQF